MCQFELMEGIRHVEVNEIFEVPKFLQLVAHMRNILMVSENPLVDVTVIATEPHERRRCLVCVRDRTDNT